MCNMPCPGYGCVPLTFKVLWVYKVKRYFFITVVVIYPFPSPLFVGGGESDVTACGPPAVQTLQRGLSTGRHPL